MSILADVKRLVAVDESYTHFDEELLLHMNALLLNAWQLGFTKSRTLRIISNTEWRDIFKDEIVEYVPEWLALKSRLHFDPPQGGAKEAVEANLDEIETRLLWQVESPLLQEKKGG